MLRPIDVQSQARCQVGAEVLAEDIFPNDDVDSVTAPVDAFVPRTISQLLQEQGIAYQENLVIVPAERSHESQRHVLTNAGCGHSHHVR